MIAAALAGLVAGYGVALPVGAIGALLVSLGARAPWRVGVAAAIGVAAADGLYAIVAVVAGGAAARALTPIAPTLRVVAAVTLLGVAAVTAWRGWRDHRRRSVARPDPPGVRRAGRTFVVFLGLTSLNPATIVYFVALVVGHGDGDGTKGAAGAVFAVAVFLASASWQILLALSGVLLGRSLTGPTGRVVTSFVAAAVIVALALRTLVGG